MENMFSAGELAKLQNISKQTLLYYDKIGLFNPSYTDAENGYRYYSAEQLDYLDTILIMKKIGFSLNEIKEYLKNYTTENSMLLLKNQLSIIQNKIDELSLIKNRLERRCNQIENIYNKNNFKPVLSMTDTFYILYNEVEKPFGMKEISIATKKCYAEALSNNLPIFFECGVSVPLKHITERRFTEANLAFLTTENCKGIPNIRKIEKGLTASIYHYGNYYEIENSYIKLIEFCKNNNLKIISNSY